MVWIRAWRITTAYVLVFPPPVYSILTVWDVGLTSVVQTNILEGIITSLKVLKTFFIPSVVGQATEGTSQPTPREKQ